MDMAPTKIIDDVIKSAITPEMKARGFRKKGATFWRDHGEVIDVVAVQKSQWNDKSSASFAINLGLYWKRVQEILGGSVSASPPRECDCTVRTRLGPLFAGGCDYWWEVTPLAEISAVGTDAVSKLVEYGLDWLERGHELDKTLEYVERLGYKRQRDAILALRRTGVI